MEIEDENHITKTALQFFAILCKKQGKLKLAQKSNDMASLITCNPDTLCDHNQ